MRRKNMELNVERSEQSKFSYKTRVANQITIEMSI